MESYIRLVKNCYHFIQALVAVAIYRYPARYLKVIAVTGTDGKTTTSSLIYHILKNSGYKVALISTVAAYIGNEQIETGFHVTSPNPVQLQRLLRRIVDQGYTHLVLESTSHGLDQFRLLGTNSKVAVVTNITHEHLDYHRTYYNYVRAKAKILKNAEYAVLNADDQSFKSLIKYVPKSCKLYPYSLNDNLNPNLLHDEDYRLLKSVIQTKFTEKYNQENAMAAFFASVVSGLSTAQFTASLPTFTGVPGRMQHIPNKQGINAIVDFAHTPNALSKALYAARMLTKGRLIVVFGAAGKRDTSKRPLMGKAASEGADEIIITAEDPRGEDVSLITEQIKSGATKNRGHLHGIGDRLEAITFAFSLAKRGDTVIVCGKGHEQSMNLDGRKEIPWSDVTAVTEVLLTSNTKAHEL